MTTEQVDGASDLATELKGHFDAAEAPTEAVAAVEAPAVETAETGAARDGAGRFTKAEAKAAAEEVDEWIQPPSALRPEYKAEWSKLDKKWRGEFYRRDQDFHKGIEPYKAGHSQWEKWQKEVLGPYMPRVQASGLPPERFVQEFLTLDHVFTTGTPQQKQQALNTVLQYYGLEAPQPGQQQTQQQIDPTVKTLLDKVQKLEGTLTQSQTAAQQREQQEALSTIGAFKADPKNIYFEDVKDDMAVLLSAGRAKDLADAYDKACRMNPAVFGAIAKQQRETEEKQRIEEAKRKTADARRAGFDVQAQGAAQSGSKTMSLREELAQAAGVQLSS